MFRKVLILTALVLAFAASNLQAVEIIDSNWVGGEFGYWGQASNWNPPIVPDNNASQTFVVTIDSNSIAEDEVFVIINQSRTIDKLDFYGIVIPDVRIWEPIWLTVHDGITNHGRLEPDDLHFVADFTNATGSSALLDEISISDGNLVNQSGSYIQVEVEISLDNDLFNDGIITIIPESTLLADGNLLNTGIIDLLHAECHVANVLDNNSTGLIKGSGVLHAGQLLQNKGQISAFGGSLAVTLGGTMTNTGILRNQPLALLHFGASPPVREEELESTRHLASLFDRALYGQPLEDANNNGSIVVNAGGGVAFDCNLVNDTNGIINLYGGTLAATTITQTADANFAGFGGITGDVVIESGGLIQLTGPTNIIGDIQIGTGATLEISDGTTLVTGHTTCNGTIHLKGGRIIPQGGLSGDCNIIWEPGLYTNIADFNLDGKVNFKDFALFADTWLWQTAWY